MPRDTGPMRLNTSDADFEPAFRDLIDSKRETEADVSDAARGIIDQVIADGDEALYTLTERFDRFDVGATGLAVTDDEVAAAVARVPGETREALEMAAERIEAFHLRQRPDDQSYSDADGVRLGLRLTAIDAAGLYVPGGTAAYPSSVLMNAIPARVAGVDRRIMVVPTPDGVLNDLVLTAAQVAGVTEIWRIGGAQAVAALAYGTNSIAPVDKIVGPGNAFVAAAKRLVFGKVDHSIAGPLRSWCCRCRERSVPDRDDLLSQAG